jgi:hypothetical protein
MQAAFGATALKAMGQNNLRSFLFWLKANKKSDDKFKNISSKAYTELGALFIYIYKNYYSHNLILIFFKFSHSTDIQLLSATGNPLA